jgi:CRP/FNR family transcriptional regulator
MGVAFGPMAEGVTRRFPPGGVITRQGEEDPCLFLVTEGAVRLASVTAGGREVIVALLGRGELFGESALLAAPSPVEARSIACTEVVALPVSSIRSIVERQPATAEQLLRLVAARLHRTRAALEEALSLDIPARVAGRLRELAADHGVHDAGGVRVELPITQEELARMVGVSRETVNRTFATFAARGLVHAGPRRLVITDLAALPSGT